MGIKENFLPGAVFYQPDGPQITPMKTGETYKLPQLVEYGTLLFLHFN